MASLVTIGFGGVVIYMVAEGGSLLSIGTLMILWVLLAALAWWKDNWLKRLHLTTTCWLSLYNFFLMIKGAAPVFIIIMWTILGTSAYLISKESRRKRLR